MQNNDFLLLLKKDNITIGDTLKYLKATKYTFYNISNSDKKEFQFKYNELKKRKDRKLLEIDKIVIELILKNKKLSTDIVYKSKIINSLLY